ncbi:hypothetical protein quinque_008312 [Culex quinquefasciatus]
MTSISGVHFLCRVCAKPFESCAMVRMFNERNKPLPLAEAFWRVSEIDIHAEDSRFPQSCCATCRDRLQEVEDLRALCLESDRKLGKMIGIGLKEEEEDEDVGMSNVTAIPKVEVQEVPESYSCWEDMENRFNSSEEESDTEESPEKSRKPRTKQQRLEERTDDAAKIGAFPDADFEPNAAEEKSKGKSKTKPKTKRQSKTSEEGTASNSKEKTPKGPQSYQCTLCGKIYKSSNNLREHETTHFPDRKNHKCHICSQEFARRNYYLRHMKMHQTENQFKCNECDKIYPSDKKLQEHIRITHRGERPFQCKICSKTFPRSFTLNHHVQAVHEKIRKKTFRCEKCTRTFESKTAYERHMNSHEGIKLNQCSHCGKNYEFKAYLLQHIAEKHPETVENLSRCQFCGVGYSTDGYYRKHIVKRHPEHLEAFDQWMKAKPEAFWRVSEIEIQVEDSRFPQSCCLRCRDRLQEVEDLRALCLESNRKLRKMIGVGLKEDEEVQDNGIGHIETFPKVEAFDISESYSCWDDAEGRLDSNEEADMEGSNDANKGNDADAVKETPKKIIKRKTKSKMKQTTKTLEAGTDNQTPKSKPSRKPKSFQCTLCGKFYKSIKSLREHETSHYPDRKNHKCPICSQEFARRKYYSTHLKMHRTENQFKCNECDKTFHEDKLLQEHIRTKHRGERPYQCKLCPKTYTRSSSLFVHVQINHENIKKALYRCDKCTKSFLNRHHYERHVNSHEGLKLNQCPHCGTKYEYKAYLVQHIAEKHPETVPDLSRCQYCGVGYSTDGYYRKHIVKRHPEHLGAFDQSMKDKRDAGSQSSITANQDAGGSSS